MRSGIIILALILLTPFAVHASQFTYGCCLPDAGNCIPGDPSVFPTSTDFQNACTAQGPGIISQFKTTTCPTQCEMGCCCATSGVAGYDAINKTEDLLKVTRWECSQQIKALPYKYVSLAGQPAGTSCVQLCGGGGVTVTSSTYTVQGTVKKTTGEVIPGANITFYGTTQVSALTDGNGHYSVSVDGNKRYTIAATPPTGTTCKPQSTDLLVDANKDLPFALDCTTAAACTNAKPLVKGLALVPGTDQATFTISYDNRCGNFGSFVPFRCQGTSCNALQTITQIDPAPTVIDSGLQPKSNPAVPYCYFVRAYNQGAGYIDGDKSCITTGDAACMDLAQDAPRIWCDTIFTNNVGTSAVLSCSQSNVLTATKCGQGQVCQDLGTGPACAEALDCSKCNGLLGFFAKLGIKVQLSTGQSLMCSQTDQCYQDRSIGTPLAISAYNYCTTVQDCSDYHDKDSCTANMCKTETKLSTACQWKTLPNDQGAELGKGICVSTDAKAVPPCKKCEDAFGYCNKDVCHAISNDCYYDGPTAAPDDSNGWKPQGCLAKQDMACRFYDTEQDCIGPNNGKPKQNATNNIFYTGNVRTGIDNARTNSSDLFGFGACKWMGTYCVKDADDHFNTPLQEDDCVEDGLTGDTLLNCLKDTTPPVTTFMLKPGNPPVYGHADINALPYQVTDDSTPVAKIKTYVCLNTSGPCYPTSTIDALSVPDVDADYDLYYYSMDDHHNSEKVRKITIRVKKDNIPTLNTVNITENS